MLEDTVFFQCKVCSRILTKQQAALIPCSGYRGPDSNISKLPESSSFYSVHGAWFTSHVFPDEPIDKIAFMRFLRDEKRICWMEIYLKVFAAGEPPLLCADCGQYYTLSQSGLCFYHPGRSEYNLRRGIRVYPCCQNEFYFSTLLCDGVQKNLLDNDVLLGCQTRFHRPVQ